MLCPLFGWSLFLRSLLLLFVTTVTIIIEIRDIFGYNYLALFPHFLPLVISLTSCFISRCFLSMLISFSSLEGYIGKSSLKLSVTCSCFSTLLASSNTLSTVLGGCHISAHLLAILFLMFFFNDEIKSFITWGCLSSLGKIPEDLYKAHPHLYM